MSFKTVVLSCFPHSPTQNQLQALEALSSFFKAKEEKPVFVLKGYAGTGKTSLMAALTQTLAQYNVPTILMAPTGRAAKVFSNYTGKRAYTIHKRIYYTQRDPLGNFTMRLQENKLSNAVIIVDEASMIPDSSKASENLFSKRRLLEDLLAFVFNGKNCRLILVGDTAQLPPVGEDFSPALDKTFLQRNFSLNIHEFELTEVVRQQQESGILHNATSLRQKIAKNNIKPPFFKLQNFPDIHSVSSAELEELLITAFSGNNMEESVVICRTNKRANLFNKEIRYRILYREHEISTGDYIMVVKNNYFWTQPTSDISFIANGDIAEIHRIQKYENIYGFRFIDVSLRFVDYPESPLVECKLLLNALDSENPSLSYNETKLLFEEIIKDYEDIPNMRERVQKVKESPYFNALQVKFAYALTCHKTQGGQWKNVFIDQGFFTDEMLNIEYLRWLYTAITRSSEKVYLLNFKESLFN